MSPDFSITHGLFIEEKFVHASLKRKDNGRTPVTADRADRAENEV